MIQDMGDDPHVASSALHSPGQLWLSGLRGDRGWPQPGARRPAQSLADFYADPLHQPELGG